MDADWKGPAKKATPLERKLILEILKLRKTKVDKNSLKKKLDKRDEKIEKLKKELQVAKVAINKKISFEKSKKAYVKLAREVIALKKGSTSVQSWNKAVYEFLKENFPDTFQKFVKETQRERETAEAMAQMSQSSSSGQKRKRQKGVVASKGLLF
jgi:hypothetical protein